MVLAFTNADTETTRTTLAAVAVGIVGAIAGLVSQGPRPPGPGA